MTNIPRVEITERALKVLKIETAIMGMNQKEALEALILRGASSRTLALVEERPLMEVEEHPQKTLMEVKPIIPNKPQVDKMECKKEGEAIICAPSRTLTPEARTALLFILEEMKAGREPTTSQVADVVRMKPTGISRELGKLGIASQNTRRDMRSVKLYPLRLQPQIEEILGKSD